MLFNITETLLIIVVIKAIDQINGSLRVSGSSHFKRFLVVGMLDIILLHFVIILKTGAFSSSICILREVTRKLNCKGPKAII